MADEQRKRRRVTVVHEAHASVADQPVIAPLPPGLSERAGTKFVAFNNGTKPAQRLMVNDDTSVRVQVSNVTSITGVAAPHPVRYAVGIYDREAKTLRVTDAAVFSVSSQIKALSSLAVPDRQVPVTDYASERTLLGETFGTKKLKAQLRAQERNKVDVEGLKHLSGVIEEGIRTQAASMPTAEDIEDSVNRARPIPPYNLSATTPAEAFPLSTLAPEEELAQIPYKDFLKIRPDDVEELRSTRTYPDYVLEKLNLAAQHSKKDRRELQLLLYLTYLLRFRNVSDASLQAPEMLESRMADTPSGIVERFVERFTEVVQSTSDDTVRTRHMTPRARDLVTEYALAVCLHLEQFTIDPTLIMPDLRLTRKQVCEYLRALGCTPDGVTAPDSTPDKPKQTRVMRLKVPLQFPKPRRGPAK